MHQSSLDNMEVCIKKHILPDMVLSGRSPLRVLDVGGAEVNGSYRPLFTSLAKHSIDCEYVTTDIAPDAKLSTVQTDPYKLQFPDDSFDVVISGQTLEHCEFFWLLFEEMARVCSPEGVIVLIVPSAGVIHRYPVDCYRFLPDSCQSLAGYADIELVESWLDERGPFHNVVGVFRSKAWQSSALGKPPPMVEEYKDFLPHPDSALEVMKGVESNIEFLKRIHAVLEPRFYLEIGVFMGSSLQLAQCPAIGIDPSPLMSADNPLRENIIASTSDEYFFDKRHEPYEEVLDLVYIDGMHLIENVLKDFINIEAISRPGTIIILDDIYPNHPVQAHRERETMVWTGDVWKIVPILRDIRPDLTLIPVNTYPAGTLIVCGADSRNRLLANGFDYILNNWQKPADPPPEVILRACALHPNDPVIVQILSRVKALRQHAGSPEDIEPVKTFFKDSLPRKVADLL